MLLKKLLVNLRDTIINTQRFLGLTLIRLGHELPFQEPQPENQLALWVSWVMARAIRGKCQLLLKHMHCCSFWPCHADGWRGWITNLHRWAAPTDASAVTTAQRPLSSAMHSNDYIDWPVNSLMLSFHDLRGLRQRRLPSTVTCSMIFASRPLLIVPGL